MLKLKKKEQKERMRKLKGKKYNQQMELRRINNEIKEKMKIFKNQRMKINKK